MSNPNSSASSLKGSVRGGRAKEMSLSVSSVKVNYDDPETDTGQEEETVKRILMQEGLESLIAILNKSAFKEQLVKQLNEDINIPIINESTEKVILDSIYDCVLAALKEAHVHQFS